MADAAAALRLLTGIVRAEEAHLDIAGIEKLFLVIELANTTEQPKGRQ
jgi:hypothetical protein